MFKPDFISVVEHYGTKTGNFCILPQFEATWIINFSIYISLMGVNGIFSSGKEGKQGIHNFSLETVHLVAECQIKVTLLNRRLLDLVSLTCRGRDVQGASLM